MNLFFRFLFLLIKRLFSNKRSRITDAVSTSFIVNFLDLDLNLHMNNGRFLSLMDLGRIDLMIKSRLFFKLFLNGYYPVVKSQSIRFRKSLNLFDSFQIITQIDSLDDLDFYISQKFICKNEIYAEGFIKGRFKKRGLKENVSTYKVMEFSGLKLEHKELSQKATKQNEIEYLLTK